MSKLLTIAKAGLSGINTDLPPWDLPAEFITDGNNFRISNAAILTNNGHILLNDFANPNIKLARVMSVGSAKQDMFIVGGATGIWAWDGRTGTKILDVSPVFEPADWSFCMMGGIPIANHPEVGAFYWNPVHSSQMLQPLPFDQNGDWDVSLAKTAKVMRSHKNFLFALNMTEDDGTGKMVNTIDSFRWSHPAAINALPPSWNDADQYFLAGISNLGAHTGRIVDGYSLRDSFCIYSEEGINYLDYTGDEFVWRRREITTTVGLIAKDCIAEVKGTHFFIGGGDILSNDGNSVQSLMHNKIRKHFNAHLAENNYKHSFVVRNNAYKEVWFCIPHGDSTGARLAYIYNWQDDSWAVRDLPNTKHAAYGSHSHGPLLWADTKKEPIQLWQESAMPWASDKKTPLDDSVMGFTDDKIYDLDPGTNFTMHEGEIKDQFTTFIERTNYPLESQTKVTTIVTLYPHINAPGPVKIRLGSHDFAGSSIRWKPEVIFDPVRDRKVNVRTTGELHAWRIESIGSGRFTFSGMDIEYEDSGAR